MDQQSPIFVGKIKDKIWIRVQGKGSFQNSINFKNFVFEMIKKGERNYVLDMSECIVIDSTFIGTIADFAFKFSDDKDYNFDIINLNNRNKHLLQTLGIERILSLENIDDKYKEESKLVEQQIKQLDKQNVSVKTLNEEMLEAHQTLAKVSNDNKIWFRDVIEYLKESTEKNN